MDKNSCRMVRHNTTHPAEVKVGERTLWGAVADWIRNVSIGASPPAPKQQRQRNLAKIPGDLAIIN